MPRSRHATPRHTDPNQYYTPHQRHQYRKLIVMCLDVRYDDCKPLNPLLPVPEIRTEATSLE
jgi:hypothetical protein